MTKKLNIRIVEIANNNCPYCQRAKEFLASKGIEFELAQMSREELRDEFAVAKFVPVVVINRKYIGGYNELVKYFDEMEAEDALEN